MDPPSSYQAGGSQMWKTLYMGLSDPAPTIAPSKKIPFRDFLDGMKPNLTLGQGLGGEVAIPFSHTP